MRLTQTTSTVIGWAFIECTEAPMFILRIGRVAIIWGRKERAGK